MASIAGSLTDVIDVARPIVERIVWCAVATSGPDGTPRSRVMHPVWWWDGDAPHALVTTRPTPLKLAHLKGQSLVTCLYWDPSQDTVTIDATATWVEPAGRRDAWRRIAAVPPPVGFDPALIWPEGWDSADCRFLHLTAHRIVAAPAGRPARRWRTGTG